MPELGRFIQPDPKEFEAGDYNLYRYCHNDPVNKTDPFGLIISEGSAELRPDNAADQAARNARQAETQKARDTRTIRDAVARAFEKLTKDKQAGSNIGPGDDSFAKILKRAKADTSDWKPQPSLHGKAIESPAIPGDSSVRLKIYDNDPKRGNDNIALVKPTQSLEHYIGAVRFMLGGRVNAEIAESYLKNQ